MAGFMNALRTMGQNTGNRLNTINTAMNTGAASGQPLNNQSGSNPTITNAIGGGNNPFSQLANKIKNTVNSAATGVKTAYDTAKSDLGLKPTQPNTPTPTPAPATALPEIKQPQETPKPDTYMGTVEKQAYLTPGAQKVEDYWGNVVGGTQKVSGVDSAQNMADKQSALQRSSAMEQAIAQAQQSGLAPGSVAYQRIIDRAMSGIENDAIARQNLVNQMQNTGYMTALDKAMGIEKEARGTAEGERSYLTGRKDIDYNRTQTQAITNKTEAQSALNAIESPQAQQALRPYLLAGDIDGFNQAYQQVMQTGTAKAGQLAPQFMGATPDQLAIKGRVDRLRILNPGKSDAELEVMAVKELQQLEGLQKGPIDQGVEDATVKATIKKLNQGTDFTTLTQDEQDAVIGSGALGAPLTSQSIWGTADSLSKARAYSKTGQPIVNMNGTPVKLLSDRKQVRVGTDRDGINNYVHMDFLPVEVNGQKYWIDKFGTWFNKEPTGVSKGHKNESYSDYLNRSNFKQYQVNDPTLGGI